MLELDLINQEPPRWFSSRLIQMERMENLAYVSSGSVRHWLTDACMHALIRVKRALKSLLLLLSYIRD